MKLLPGIRPNSYLSKGCRRLSPLVLVSLAVLMVLLPSCDDPDPPRRNPTEPTLRPGLSFTPEQSSVFRNQITLGEINSTQDTITLVLTINTLEGLFGYGVDLVFDDEVISFDGFEEGGFLAVDGEQTTTQVRENPVGRIVIGQSRLGAVDGVTGTGTLLVLMFHAARSGSTTIRPEEGVAFDADGNRLQIRFFGGTVRVVR